MSHYRFYITLALFIVGVYFNGIAQGISMSPTRLFVTGQPGETISKPVLLRNSSNTDYVFNVHLKDWYRKENGDKAYEAPGSLAGSNAEWITTDKSTIKLPAHEEVEVMVHMHIPKNASHSELTNSMLFFSQIGKQKDQANKKTGIGIITLIEFGLHVYYTPPANHTRSLDISAIKTDTTTAESPKTVAVNINNNGDMVSDAKVKFELTNKDNGDEIKLTPINISMMPGAEQTVKFNLPDNLKGSYLGVAIIKIADTDDLSVGEKNFRF